MKCILSRPRGLFFLQENSSICLLKLFQAQTVDQTQKHSWKQTARSRRLHCPHQRDQQRPRLEAGTSKLCMTAMSLANKKNLEVFRLTQNQSFSVEIMGDASSKWLDDERNSKKKPSLVQSSGSRDLGFLGRRDPGIPPTKTRGQTDKHLANKIGSAGAAPKRSINQQFGAEQPPLNKSWDVQAWSGSLNDLINHYK